jgi:hypothetical protein
MPWNPDGKRVVYLCVLTQFPCLHFFVPLRVRRAFVVRLRE